MKKIRVTEGDVSGFERTWDVYIDIRKAVPCKIRPWITLALGSSKTQRGTQRRIDTRLIFRDQSRQPTTKPPTTTVVYTLHTTVESVVQPHASSRVSINALNRMVFLLAGHSRLLALFFLGYDTHTHSPKPQTCTYYKEKI